MTDRELLELAAKAAGIEYMRGEQPHFNYPDMLTLDTPERFWAPLTDDGGALRLAVKLGMDVCFGANYVTVRGSVQAPTVNNASDPYLATRHAIVRAAADIGRQASAATAES